MILTADQAQAVCNAWQAANDAQIRCTAIEVPDREATVYNGASGFVLVTTANGGHEQHSSQHAFAVQYGVVY